MGKQLGFSGGVTLLKATLEQEKATDAKLAEFAEKAGNAQAAA
jgi:ferritin-like metal-binding protein YciE